MNKLRIVFIGGLTNGKIVHDYLSKNKYVDLVLTITYPDGINKARMESFPDKNTVKTLNANSQFEEIEKIKPDYIFVAGWSELLSKELLELPKYGTIGFHPSKLPYDRGRSVLAWQIEEGYSETALTMFYYNDFPDGGDIIAQEKIVIRKENYINDVLNKVDDATYNLMKAYFPLLRKGLAPRLKQDLNVGNFRRLRSERDSLIDWNSNVTDIYNKIRAIAPPYPGTIAIINNKKIKIIHAQVIDDFSFGNSLPLGEIVATLYDDSIIVKCLGGYLKINAFEEL